MPCNQKCLDTKKKMVQKQAPNGSAKTTVDQDDEQDFDQYLFVGKSYHQFIFI